MKKRTGSGGGRELAALYGTYKNCVIQQGYLRAEIELVDGQPIYTFDFKKSKGNRSVTENLLPDNDVFRAMAIRVYLGVRETANPAIMVKQTYPNEFVFGDETTASPTGTFNPKHLEAIYNSGVFNYKKGDTTYINALPLTDARFVSLSQQTTAANRSSTDDTPGIPMRQPFTVMGIDQGEMSVVIPGAAPLKVQYTTAANAGKRVILILELHGWTVSGGGKIATAADRMPGLPAADPALAGLDEDWS